MTKDERNIILDYIKEINLSHSFYLTIGDNVAEHETAETSNLFEKLCIDLNIDYKSSAESGHAQGVKAGERYLKNKKVSKNG